MGVGDMRGTWVPESQRTPAWRLFNELFTCRVANIQTMSAEYIAHFGTPDSGDPLLDKETVNESVIKMLTINQIAEFFKEGICVYVVNLKDTKIIYEIIVDHLSGWKIKMSESFHIANAPIDDLLLLDKLATSVYKHAAPQFTTSMADSLIARRMSTVMRVNRESIMKLPVNKVTTINAIEEPKRESMAESFSKHRQSAVNNGGGGKWR